MGQEENGLIVVETDPVLSKLAPAHQLLAQARDAGDAKQVADLARAAEVYARRQKLGAEAILYAIGIRVLAYTVMGGFLEVGPKNQGTRSQLSGRDSSGSSTLELPEDPTPTYAELGIDRKDAMVAQALSYLKREAPERHARVYDGKVSLSGVVREVKKARAVAAILAEPPPLPEGPFRVIVADPPWTYAARASDGSHRAANPYPSMSLDDIKALDVPGIAHADALLWLWTTNAHMRDAFGVLDAWGFAHKTILTWVKDHFGTGDWLRGQTEHCLLAVRGKPTVQLTNQTTVIHGPLREHSRKPKEFYTLVEALCPGSKVELFAREPRQGWAQHGNEI